VTHEPCVKLLCNLSDRHWWKHDLLDGGKCSCDMPVDECAMVDGLMWPGIANSLDLTDRVLPRLHIKAHCRPKLVHFAPYTRNEITAILDSRLAQVSTIINVAAAAACFSKAKASVYRASNKLGEWLSDWLSSWFFSVG